MEVPNDGVCDSTGLIDPLVEAEIALIFKEGLRGPGVDSRVVRASNPEIRIALEIIDRRFTSTPRLVDLIADHAFASSFVVGPEIVVSSRDHLTVTLVSDPPRSVVQGTVSSELSDPFGHVAWLANALAGLGREIVAGDVVLTGSVTPPLSAGAGIEVSATVGETEVRTRFAEVDGSLGN
jgi:2-keto-4-pentenoate hydratase